MSKEIAMKLTNEMLDKKCELVVFDSNEQKTENERLAVKMFAMMRASNGIGLAANQIGFLKKIVAVNIQDQVK